MNIWIENHDILTSSDSQSTTPEIVEQFLAEEGVQVQNLLVNNYCDVTGPVIEQVEDGEWDRAMERVLAENRELWQRLAEA